MKILIELILSVLIITVCPGLSNESNPIANDKGISENITGNWGGLRDGIEEFGIELDAVYKGELWGTKSKNNLKSCYTDNIDLTALFDFDKILGLGNTSLFAHVLGNHGNNIADDAGAAQGISNIAAFNTWKLFELYVETSLFENRLNFLVGMYDLNSQFDYKTANQLFINPSHGIGVDWAQSGENGPSIFPTSSFGMRVRYCPVENMYVQYSALDGVSGDPNRPNGTHLILDEKDGLLSAIEIGYSKGNKTNNLPGNDKHIKEPYTKFAVGYWHYTDNYKHPFSGIKNWGLYLLFEQDIYNKSENPEEGLTIEGRIGIADDETNQFDAYIGAGLIYKGVFQETVPDELGIGIASAHNTFSFRNFSAIEGNQIKTFEHILELTYKYYIIEAIAIQPDLQYVINPCNQISNENVIVFGMRLITVF